MSKSWVWPWYQPPQWLRTSRECCLCYQKSLWWRDSYPTGKWQYIYCTIAHFTLILVKAMRPSYNYICGSISWSLLYIITPQLLEVKPWMQSLHYWEEKALRDSWNDIFKKMHFKCDMENRASLCGAKLFYSVIIILQLCAWMPLSHDSDGN